MIIRNPLFAGALAFITIFILTQYAAYLQYRILADARQEEVDREMQSIENRLKSALSYSLSATKVLAFYIERNGVPEDFDAIARDILASNKYIDALQLTRKGVIINTYPLQGNEVAIGYDILADPYTRVEAEKAIRKRELFFAGPFELKQGGMAVVGRLPIFIKDEFWGFSVVLIRLPTLLEASGINTRDDAPFRYQLSKINPNTQQEEFYLPEVELHKSSVEAIDVPDGEWKLYVFREDDASLSLNVLAFSFLGLVLSVTGALFVWHYARQPERLNRLVQEKTFQLATSSQEKEIVLNRITDGVVSVDNNWRYTFLNNAALATHPLGREETIGKSIWDVHPEMMDTIFWDKYHEAMNTRNVVEVESHYPPMDKWFSVKVYPSSDGLTIFYKDITESKKTEQEVIRSRARLQAILENTTDYIWSVDTDYRLLVCNTPFREFVFRNSGRNIREGDNIADVIPVEHKEDVLQLSSRAFNGEQFSVERERQYSGVDVVIEYFFHPICNEDDQVSGISVFMRDITERRRAQHAVEIERNLSESIINSLPGIFYLYDQNGKFIRWNKNFETVSEYSAEEMLNMGPLDFFDEDEKELLKSRIQNVFNTGMDEVDAHFLTKSGKKIPYYFNGWRVTIEKEVFLIGVGLDITDRKRAEQEIKQSQRELRQLSAHLQTIREDERLRIAREIHDELGQQLTGLKMDTAWIIRRLTPDDEEVKEKMNGMLTLIDETVRSVRRISSELRPSILDDFGLVAAIEWQSKEFEKRFGITSTFQSNIRDVELSGTLAINVYRIFQEALTNVARHSRATHVETQFEKTDTHLILTIRDNGKGFTDSEAKEKKTLGLVGMKERALMLGGELVIESSKTGNGTTVQLTVPLEIKTETQHNFNPR